MLHCAKAKTPIWALQGREGQAVWFSQCPSAQITPLPVPLLALPIMSFFVQFVIFFMLYIPFYPHNKDVSTAPFSKWRGRGPAKWNRIEFWAFSLAIYKVSEPVSLKFLEKIPIFVCQIEGRKRKPKRVHGVEVWRLLLSGLLLGIYIVTVNSMAKFVQ